jgi:hypothetical protein
MFVVAEPFDENEATAGNGSMAGFNLENRLVIRLIFVIWMPIKSAYLSLDLTKSPPPAEMPD